MTDNKVYFLNRNAESLQASIRAYTGCINVGWGDKLNQLAGRGALDDVFASAFGTSDNSGIRLRLENYKTQKAETVPMR